MSELTDVFTGIASAIRSKTGSSSAFTPAQMITEIENIPTGDNVKYIAPAQYVYSTISNYEGDESLILDSAFRGCYDLSTISLPNVTFIGGSAFERTSLSQISFPLCSHIGQNGFSNCSSITTVDLPMCQRIEATAFYSCRNLTTVSLPFIQHIESSVFASCSKLTTLYMFTPFGVPELYSPNAFSSTSLKNIYVKYNIYNSIFKSTYWSKFSSCIKLYSQPGGLISDNTYSGSTITTYTGSQAYVGEKAFYNCRQLSFVSMSQCDQICSSAFAGCANLTSVSFPNCTFIGNSGFARTGLINVTFPNCSYIGGGAFMDCTDLICISLPKVKCIAGTAFGFCSNLSSFYVLTDNIPYIGMNAFAFGPIASGNGTIYVKQSLVNDFKKAANWSYYSSQIIGI